MNEVYLYAVKLLRTRDYTTFELRKKIEAKFGLPADDVLLELSRRKFLNDQRFAENYVARRKHRGPAVLRDELLVRGVASELADEVLAKVEWPSLRQALAATMNGWKLRAPLQSRDVARLFRALHRLGYDEDAIREEIDRLHEQQ